MKIICLMGMSNSGKTAVATTLENMGFKRSISYTTRKPQVRNGVLEEHGKQYMFVTREQFNKLVEDEKIIEHEEYNGNLYGTPRPYGAKMYVAVVCVGGYKALKEIYGNQVLGVYLKCSYNTAVKRANQRDNSLDLIKDRKEIDNGMLAEMENSADIIIDSNQDFNRVIANILKALQDRNIVS